MTNLASPAFTQLHSALPARAPSSRRCQPGLEVEAVDRLADPSLGPLQGVHQDQRRQVAEVLPGAQHALIEALMGVALPRRIAGMCHGDHAVGDLPSVESLLQRFMYGVLDGIEKRERHRP
jgi:hypothetical protein